MSQNEDRSASDAAVREPQGRRVQGFAARPPSLKTSDADASRPRAEVTVANQTHMTVNVGVRPVRKRGVRRRLSHIYWWLRGFRVFDSDDPEDVVRWLNK